MFRPLGMPLKIPGWVWMLLSCLDGETTLAEAAHAVKLDSRVAADAIESLLDEKLVTLEPATGPGGTCVTGA